VLRGPRTYSGRRPCHQDGRCAPSAFSRTATDGGRYNGRATDRVRGDRAAGLTFTAELSVHVPASARCPAGFPGGRPGKGGCGDGQGGGPGGRDAFRAGGRAGRARVARSFISEVLGPGHPCGDVAVLLVSEIFGNSVRHSGSGAAGETVTVAVRAGDGIVRVEVTDRAGSRTPELRPAGRDVEGGRGLQLVAALAARWGWRRRGGQMVTWFETQADFPDVPTV
jgi:anti-sigma regulatory factor (Ser/Thr protein kinase)